MDGLAFLGSTVTGVEKAIAGNAGEKEKVLKADDPSLAALVAAGVAETGKAAPGSTLPLGRLYIRTNEAGTQVIGLYLGQKPSAPIFVADFTGTPAAGSIASSTQFAASLLDGASGVPSMRTLTNIARIVGVKPLKLSSGEYLTGIHSATRSEAQQSTGVKNILFLTPVNLADEFEFDRISTYITVKGEGTGLIFRLGLYADDGWARPTGSPLFESGELPATEVGECFKAITQKLAPGRYWTGWVMQGTVTVGPKITTYTPVTEVPTTSLAPGSFGAWKQTSVSGALPAIGTLEPSGTYPLVGLRVK